MRAHPHEHRRSSEWPVIHPIVDRELASVRCAAGALGTRARAPTLATPAACAHACQCNAQLMPGSTVSQPESTQDHRAVITAPLLH